MKTITYNALYTDKKDSQSIVIQNNSKVLSFQLGDFKFEGTSFDDFELLNAEKYSLKELDRFTFNKIASGNGFSYEICNYDLTIYIPTELIDTSTGQNISTELKVLSSCGLASKNGGLDRYDLTLELTVDKTKYTGKGDLFEIASNNLIHSSGSQVKFKNCFGCNFSDYSVYGQGVYGTMLCFKNQKEEYLKVKTKDQYMKLEREDRLVQETFCCEEFKMRNNNIGYRG